MNDINHIDMHTTTARDGVNTILDIVEFFWWLDPKEISPES